MLTLHPAATGVLPYMATAYPLEGAVPNGSTVVSADDPNMRATVISRWPDGSASVVVMAGETNVTANVARSLALTLGTPVGTPLTTARITALVSSIAVNFGAGVQTLSSFGSPDRVWWANSQVICARYRLSCNLGQLEAVIDIHAFAGSRAFVEVVIENAKFNANGTSQPAPSNQSYTNATVAVNGSTIATVNSSGGPDGSHRGFSAWYASTWIGGDPQIEVTHDTASMQAHPVFFRLDKTASTNLQTLYQADAYTPWYAGRHRASGMGGAGDHESIGYLTQWDAHYLQSGSRFARRAVLASGLAILRHNINYRHTDSSVPTHDQSNGKLWSTGTWPEAGTENGNAGWEVAHHPGVGLMAFLCRPSPCFIEIAQKAALKSFCWSNGVNFGANDGTMGPWYAVRARAWGIRTLGWAIFLTPDGHGWKTPARACLARNVTASLVFRDSVKNKLDTTWGGDPYLPWDDNAGGRFETSTFQSFYFIQAVHAIANAKVLTGGDQTNMAALADWAVKFPVRYCNESPGGAFRAMPQRWSIGATGGANFTAVAMDQYADWAEMVNTTISGTLPAVSGPWLSEAGDATTWSTYGTDTSAGAYYPSYYWAALCCAVERDVAGASAAWTKVTGGNITNLSTWRNGFQTEPRWGYYPRNK